MKTLAFALVLCLLPARVCVARQNGSAPPAPKTVPSQASMAGSIDPQLRSDILHMLAVNHALDKAQSTMRTMFNTMRPQLSATLPATPNRDKIVDAYLEKLVGLAQKPEFTDGIVAVYAKYFSDDDIKALAQFYQTPAGQHFNDHLSDVMSDSVKFGQQLFMQNMNGIFGELCKEYPELQGQAKFCPASGETKGELLPSRPKPSKTERVLAGRIDSAVSASSKR